MGFLNLTKWLCSFIHVCNIYASARQSVTLRLAIHLFSDQGVIVKDYSNQITHKRIVNIQTFKAFRFCFKTVVHNVLYNNMSLIYPSE